MLTVALAQINSQVGDLEGNCRRIVAAAEQAQSLGAQLLLTPELSLTGYPPEDLVLRPGFQAAVDQHLDTLACALAVFPSLHVVVGHPFQPDARGDQRTRSSYVPMRFNAASVINQGTVRQTVLKRELPNYQVFDERRTFAPASACDDPRWASNVIDVAGCRLALLICEDAWFEAPAAMAVSQGAQALCVINASPFHGDKCREREVAMGKLARNVQRPLLYAHGVGGQDELVFDGGSFALDANGAVVAREPLFEESLALLTLEPSEDPTVAASAPVPMVLRPGRIHPIPCVEQQVWSALVLGVRDYAEKNRFPSVILGLSGGVDSALVLAVAVDALGPERVRTVMMPSEYTADISWIDARDMAERLKVRHDEIAIGPLFQAFKSSLELQFAGLPQDTTEENLQARIRGTLLMALSNKTGALVLTTGNKSEMATGYCTLYGDMAGGFAVIKDVCKTLVWRLCRWRNQQADRVSGAIREVIPTRIIDRPPSAELRPDQTDQDSLPPYDILDAIVQRYVEDDQSPADIIAAGYSEADVLQVVRLIRINEYKRRQAPPGVRITHRAFGRDWRQPITQRFPA